jgi:hypothetical protein
MTLVAGMQVTGLKRGFQDGFSAPEGLLLNTIITRLPKVAFLPDIVISLV